MIRIYDRNGKRISMERFSFLLGDLSYKRVGYTELDPGLAVSTVWLGIDHNWSGHGRRLIFETAVIRSGTFDIRDRYSTLQEAKAGHAATVNGLRLAALN